MSEKIKRTIKRGIPNKNRDDMYPRTITAQSSSPADTLSATSSTSNVSRGPTRRFYAPELMLSNMFIPTERVSKNRWRRWFYEHDTVVGAVMDLLSDLPWSNANLTCPDPLIKKIYEEVMEKTNFLSMCPFIEREYNIIGEVIVHFYFDEKEGIWSHIVVHNPDYIDIEDSPIVNMKKKISIIPDEALRILTMSQDDLHVKARKRLPNHVLKSILYGQNILLNEDRTAHMARIIKPGAVRGTSITDRIFRTCMTEDKMIEAQISIADNFIYPLRIFKLGSPEMGIPPKEHADALAELLLQAQFDPNFSLIYSYALQYEEHGHEGKLLRLDAEFERTAKEKMIALGVNSEFLMGTATFASANVYLNMLFSRMATARMHHERSWIYPKFFKTLAEIRGFKKITQAELAHGIRVKRSQDEEEWIIPKLEWQKSLTGREDREYLDFLKDRVDKGEVSKSTLLSRAGLDYRREMENIKEDERIRLQVGVEEKEQKNSLAFFKNMKSKFGDIFSRKKEKEKEEEKESYQWSNKVIEAAKKDSKLESFREKELVSSFNLKELNRSLWQKSLKRISSYPMLYDLYTDIDDNIDDTEENQKILIKDIYQEGRRFSYSQLTLPFDNISQATDELIFEDFINFKFSDNELMFRKACLDAFVLGQLISYRELGVDGVRICYANLDAPMHMNRYNTEKLLSKSFKLSELIYPNYEIVYLHPEIDSYVSKFYPFKRFADVKKEEIYLKNLPIEYQSLFLEKDIKLGRIKEVEFVKELHTSDEWLQTRVAHYRKIKMEETLISQLVVRDAQKQIPIEVKGKVILPLSIFKQNGNPIELIKEEIKKIKN